MSYQYLLLFAPVAMGIALALYARHLAKHDHRD